MFDMVPHDPVLVSPITSRAFNMAVGLGLSDRAPNHRSLGFPLDCNGRLKSKNGRLVVALQCDLNSAGARRL